MQLFGEVVLGLSQGSVSELLCKPKPWHMLSIKGREPFIRMQLWLTDPGNVDKLHAARAEKLNESAKRKRSALEASAAAASPSPGSPSEFSDAGADSPGSASAAKRPRVLFTTKQKEALKIAFSLDPYPSAMTTEFLCQELGLEPRSVGNWFHNHRMRLKQTHPHELDSLLPPPRGEEQQRPLDPLHFKLLVNQRPLELSQHAGGPASPPDSPAEAKSPRSESSGLDLSQQRQREVESGSPEAADRPAASAPSGGGGGGRSRRKPLAPQWVNPAAAWKDAGDDAAKEAAPGSGGEDEMVGDVD